VTSTRRSHEPAMIDQSRPLSRPWRRFLRFSVRGLIVLVLVIGVWLGWVVRLAHNQRDAVAAIERAGGRVSYDWEWSDGIYSPGGKPWAPRWLTDLIGVDYFGHVTYVRLSRFETSSIISQIERLARLQRLRLVATSFSDAGIAHLNKLTELTSLDLRGTKVTDAGLVHLAGLSKISVLNLDDTQVSDAGLLHLRGLRNLEWLGISRTSVSDDGKNELKRALPNVSVFDY
jgi:internalin A